MNKDFKIVEVSENEFIVYKKYIDKKTIGYLWWEKTINIDSWERITKKGERLSFNNYIFQIQTYDLIEYTNIEEARKFIKDVNKYPKKHTI